MCAWDKAQAEKEFLHALELNPRYIQARLWYAFTYLQLSAGRLEEGVVQAKLMLESDPLSSYANTVYGMACLNSGRHTEAVQAARRAVELDSESFLAWFCLQGALHLQGQFEESVAVAESALAMSGRHCWSMAVLAVTLADWHKPVEAAAVYAEMVARAGRQYLPPAVLAVAAFAARKKRQALRYSREALETRDPNCQVFFTGHNAYSAQLCEYSRFRELLTEFGFR
jgi:tetratricopeptide (TPR) repeat protein